MFLKVSDIVEKPETPISNVAIGGIYLYDERFWDILDETVKEKGADFSISDVNRWYIKNSNVNVRNLQDETWLDCGTPDALIEASLMAVKGLLSPEPCNIRDGDVGLGD